jgi:cytochrome c55X
MKKRLQLRMRVTRCHSPPRETLASAVFFLSLTASLSAHPVDGGQRAGTMHDGSAPARHLELRHLIQHDCGSCHGMTLAGGLGPALTATALRDKPLQYIEAMILRGRPGTAMPGWAGLLSESDVRWIARQLKEGLDR